MEKGTTCQPFRKILFGFVFGSIVAFELAWVLLSGVGSYKIISEGASMLWLLVIVFVGVGCFLLLKAIPDQIAFIYREWKSSYKVSCSDDEILIEWPFMGGRHLKRFCFRDLDGASFHSLILNKFKVVTLSGSKETFTFGTFMPDETKREFLRKVTECAQRKVQASPSM